MIRVIARGCAKLSPHLVGEGPVQRLLSVLAWADCQEASFRLAAGDVKGTADRVVQAIAKLDAVRRLGRRRRGGFWRPMVKSRAR